MSHWKSWLGLFRKKRQPFTRLRGRLRLECLEDRLVPCTPLVPSELAAFIKLGVPIPPNFCTTMSIHCSNSSYANTDSPVISGVLSGGMQSSNQVTANLDGAGAVNVPLGSGGHFAFPTQNLSDGPHTVLLHGFDAGDETANLTVSFFVKTDPPTVTINSPAANAITKSRAITGVVTEPAPSPGIASINASVNGHTPTSITFDHTTNTFSFSPSSLVQGTNTVTFTATDKAGNKSDPASITFIFDNQTPKISITSPAANATTNQPVQGTFSDAADNVTAIKATVDGQASATAVAFTAGGSGNFTFPVDGLSNGKHTIALTATDQVGNSATTSTLTFTVSITGPVLTLSPIASLVNHVPTITGTFSDGLANVTSIAVTVDGAAAGQATFVPGKSGNISFTPGILADGSHTVSFTATDQSARTGTHSVTFMLDTQLPILNVTAPPSPISHSPKITGTFSDAQDKVTSISVTVDGSAAGQATFTAGKSGNFSFTPGTLANGPHTVVFVASDQAGNQSSVGSGTVTFTRATATPVLNVTAPPAATKTSPTISGTFSDNTDNITSIGVTVDGTAIGQASFTAGRSGNFHFATSSLANGSHTVKFKATDAASATTTQSVTFMVDNQAPTLRITAPTSPATTLPTITGTFSDSLDNVTSIAVTVDGTAAGQATFTAAKTGSLSFSPSGLLNGLHTVAFTATDQAGNASAAKTVTFTLAATGPTLAVTTPSGPSSQLPTITGTFTDSSAFVSSIAVTVDGVAAGQASFTAGNHGNFSFTPGLLPNGTHTVGFTATDQANHSSGPQSVTFVLDAQPPSLSITSPAPGPLNHSPTITGAFSDNFDNVTSIAVTVDGVAAGQASFTAGKSGNFSFTPGTLADGPHTIVFTATDQAGNNGNASTGSQTILIATAPPTLTVAPVITPTNHLPIITGNFSDSQTNVTSIAVTVDGIAAGQAAFTTGLSGNFSFTPGSLADGSHTISFIATDQAGNKSATQAVTFSLFTAAPTLTISAPATPTGHVPAITGTFSDSEDNVTSIAVTVDGSAAGQATFTAGKSGNVSFTPGALADGLHTVSFVAADQAGNTSSTQTVTFTLSTAKPTIKVTIPPNSGQAFSANPLIEGTFSDPVTVSSITVTVDGTSAGAVTFTAGTSGNFSFTPALAVDGTKDGPHTVVFTATDQIGNPASATFTFTLATKGPAIDVTAPPVGFATNVNPTVQGQVTDKAGTVTSLTASVDGGTAASVSVGANGNFSFTTALNITGADDGPHTVTFTGLDNNGHTGTINYNFTLATKAPALTISQTPSGSLLKVSPSYSGTFSAEVTVNSIAVAVDGHAVGQATFTPGTGGALSFASSGLADGSHTVGFVAIDAAGNLSAQNFTFVIDSQSPTLSVTQPATPTNHAPTINGTFNDAGDNVTSIAVTVDGVAAGQATFTAGKTGNFSFTPGALADGTHTVGFMASDQLGNSTSTPTTVTFTLDTLKPTLTLTPPSSPINHSPTLGGSFSDSEDNVTSIAVTVDGNPAGQATFTAGQTGSLSFTPGSLPDGAHTVMFTATDQAGNTSNPQSATFTLFTVAPTLSITPPANPTNHSPTITGTFSDLQVNVTSIAVAVDGISAGQAAFNSAKTGSLSFTPGALADGTHTVTFIATDQVGNVSASQSVTFSLFTATPALSAGQPSSPTRLPPTLPGTFTSSEDNITSIAVTVDGAAAGQATFTPGKSGSFSFTPGTLADGPHAVTFTATDQAGNHGAPQPVVFTVFTVPPTVSITSPVSPTNHSPTISGTFSDNLVNVTSIAVAVDGNSAGQATFTAAKSGVFSFTPGSLADGTHTVTFTAADQIGNVGTPTPVTFALFTAAPALSITPPIAATKTSPTIVGTFSSSEDNITSIAVTVDGVSAGQATFTPGQSGNLSFTPGILADGAHAVTFRATDQAGNSSTQSATFFVDTKAPTINLAGVAANAIVGQSPTITANLLDVAPGSGLATVTASVNGGAAVTVKTYSSSPVVSSDSVAFNPNLATDGSADGTNTVSFTVTDNAGNSTTTSVSFSLDTVGPKITITSPLQGSVVSQSPSVTGQVTDLGAPVSGATASVDGGTAVSLTLAADGTFSFPANLPIVAEGLHAVQITATDQFGKTTTTTVSFTLASVLGQINLAPQVNIITSLAFDPTTARLYVANYSTIYQIDATRGNILASYAMPGGGSNAMQVLPAAMTLGGTAVPAGTLLVYNAAGSTAQIFALNPNTGAILAGLSVPSGVNNGVGIAFSPSANAIFLLESGVNRVVALNPADGSVLYGFSTPYSIGYGGLAIDPNNGDLWIVSVYTNMAYQVDPTTGAVQQQVNLAGQGPQWNVTGLAIIGGTSGNLLAEVSIIPGTVFKVTLT